MAEFDDAPVVRSQAKLLAALEEVNKKDLTGQLQRGREFEASQEAKKGKRAAAEQATEAEHTKRVRAEEKGPRIAESTRAKAGEGEQFEKRRITSARQQQAIERARRAGLAEEATLQQRIAGVEQQRRKQIPRDTGFARTQGRPGTYGQPTITDPRRQIPQRTGPGRAERAGGYGTGPTAYPSPGAGGVSGRLVDAEAARRHAEAMKASGAAAEGATKRQAGFSNALRQNVVAHGAAGQALRTHGALTTEFFSALKRGETTLGEVRYQTAATTAKFAGWTLAAVAVYGMVGAFAAVGKGAIDVNTQISQLKRYLGNGLDTSLARNQLVELSEEFNLPIDEVGTAFAKMSQIFHTQSSAFSATKVALQAVTIGELNAADATRYLTAIQQGAGLKASELQTVFDQVNYAQNKYGVSTRDTVAGVAKATGAWKTAGGSLRQLLALITIAKKYSGRTGEEIGTAFQRSAADIYRRPKNQKQLREFGIDPKQDISKIYHQALDKVQRGDIKGKDLNKLAAALGTPNQAPKIVAALRHAKEVDKAEEAYGKKGRIADTRKKELEAFLHSAQQQIQRVGTEFGAIGAQFGDSGFAEPFKLALVSLNLSLHVAVQLLEVFNGLPTGLRKSAAILVEAAVAMRVLSRLGVGGRIGLPTGAVQARANAREPVAFADKQVNSAREQRSAALYRQQVATGAAGVPAASLAEQKAAQDAVIVAERELAVATTLAAEATTAYAATVRQTSRPLLGGKNLRNAEAAAAAARNDAAVAAPGAGRYESAGQRARNLEREGRGRLTQFGIPAASSTGAAEGAATKEAGKKAGATAAAAGRASFLSRFTSFLTNPMVLIGGFLASVLIEAAVEQAHKSAADIDNLKAGPDTIDEENRLRARKHKEGLLPGVQKFLAAGSVIPGPVAPVARFGAGIISFYNKHIDKVEETNHEIDRGVRRANLRLQQERDAKAGRHRTFTPPPDLPEYLERSVKGPIDGDYKGKPYAARGQYGDRVLRDAKAAVDAQKTRRKSRAATQRELDRLEEEADSAKFDERRDKKGHLIGPSQRQQQLALQLKIRRMRERLGPGEGKSLADILDNLSLEKFQKRMGEDADAISTYLEQTGHLTGVKGFGVDAKTDLQGGVNKALRDVRKNPTVKNIKELATMKQETDKVFAAISKSLDDDLKLAAGDPAAAARAFDRAGGQIGKAPAVSSKQRRLALQEKVDKQVAFYAKELDDDLKLATSPEGRASAFARAAAGIRHLPRGRQRDLAERERRDKQFNAFKEDLDASLALGQARTPDAGRDAQLAISAARAELAQARKLGQDKKAIQSALQKLFEAYRQAAEAKVGLIESQGAIAIARQTTDTGRASAQLQADSNVLRAMKASGQYSQTELNNQIAKVIGDRVALADALHEQAKDLADSILDLQSSRTEDPVKLADFEYKRALNNLKFAKTPAERNHARAEVNRTRRNARNVRQQEGFDDLQFEYDMGKLERSAYISRLQAYLKTIKGNRELKRQIQRTIKQLQDEQSGDRDSFELNVADIRIPTVYDVRRGLGAPRRTGNNVAYTNAPTVNVTVNDPAAAENVYAAIDRTSNAGVRQAARAAGAL